MAVRWPDGSYTGSVRVDLAPAPVEPEPETQDEKSSDKKKESDHGNR